ncbi:nucleotidyltransferase [Elysia marginata]|uniref:Nucleotidyltransferase n=1 Tax=Elysia marginata TaxID=1093978 RepID=A0AAV4F011_9GAST|nr:nucleotidyltransferase [Elysia marginata]
MSVEILKNEIKKALEEGKDAEQTTDSEVDTNAIRQVTADKIAKAVQDYVKSSLQTVVGGGVAVPQDGGGIVRSKQDILKEINTEADKLPALNELQANTSKVAFWKALKDIVAFAILTLEKAFNHHLNEVKTMIIRTEPGTDEWYKDLALNYQDGDTIAVQNNRTVYLQKDESKRIIKRVSITENPEGGFKIKVAKAGSSGLAPLTDEARTRFSVYIGRVKFVGVPIEVVSLPADSLSITATIELDSLLFKADGSRLNDGKTPIDTAITDYLESFPFDTPFYLSKLVDAVQSVEGVMDMNIWRSALNGVEFWRLIAEVPAGYLTLDKAHSNITYVLN